MNFLLTFGFLPALAAMPFPFPFHHSAIKPGGTKDFESSGSGPDKPFQGIVKVVKLDPLHRAQPGLFRRGLAPRMVHSSRSPFPAFLSLGRPAPAKVVVPSRTFMRHESHAGLDMKRRQGLQMWQKAMHKGDHGKTPMSLPVNLKDAGKQTCTAVPFTHQVTDQGCNTVTVHNKLCFGQCSSLFVPSGGEVSGLPGPGHRHAPCSRCAPSKALTVVVPLRCGTEVREKHVMVVEECKCETGREEGTVGAHL